jgi:hypothetical protein
MMDTTGNEPQFRSEFMRRYVQMPWVQIAGIACFVYLAAKDADKVIGVGVRSGTPSWFSAPSK